MAGEHGGALLQRTRSSPIQLLRENKHSPDVCYSVRIEFHCSLYSQTTCELKLSLIGTAHMTVQIFVAQQSP